MNTSNWYLETSEDGQKKAVCLDRKEDAKSFVIRLGIIAGEFFGSWLLCSEDEGLVFMFNHNNTPDCILNDDDLLARCLCEFLSKQFSISAFCEIG